MRDRFADECGAGSSTVPAARLRVRTPMAGSKLRVRPQRLANLLNELQERSG